MFESEVIKYSYIYIFCVLTCLVYFKLFFLLISLGGNFLNKNYLLD